MFDVRIDDAELKKLLDLAKKGAPDLVEKAIDDTAALVVRKINETYPRRTGNLAKSFLIKKLSKLSRMIFTNQKYVDTLEDGRVGGGRMIFPKQAGALLIPLAGAARTSRGILRRGKAMSKGIAEGNILLRKSAKMSDIPAQHIMRDKIYPYATKALAEEMSKVFRKLFGQ